MNDSKVSEPGARFLGVERLYGRAAVDALSKLQVIIVGIGGVGSWTAEALARSGVGNLCLIDMDDICCSNINRQCHALEHTIGQQKVQAMEDRIKQINPACQVDGIELFLTPDNAGELLACNADWVVDATDRMSVKAAILGTCRQLNKRAITVGGAGGLTNPALLEISDLGRAGSDDLLRMTRKKLRRSYGWASGSGNIYGVPAVFSRERLPLASDSNGSPYSANLDCAGSLGAVCHVTAAFGLAAASIVINNSTEP